jgi:hypothetical protein
VTVDWESFRAIGNGQQTLDALKRLRDDFFSSVHYALFHLRKDIPLDACLESLHFRNVQSIDERAITVDGPTITFSVPLVERSTCYSTEAVQEQLAELVKKLPIPKAEEATVEESAATEEVEEPEDVEEMEEAPDEPQDDSSGTEEAPTSPFQQMVASMESDMMGPMRAQMSQLFGADFGLKVDWDSMEEDQDHFNLVVSRAMGAVMGALMVMAYEPATRETVTAAVRGMVLRYDPAVVGVSLALENGVLNVSCGGPADQYTQDPQGMGEAIKTLLP